VFLSSYRNELWTRAAGEVFPRLFRVLPNCNKYFYWTIRLWARDFYLNNRVFLSRKYRLIVDLRKFDVLKTNICPRSEASRANMLVLRTSNFQVTTIRSIVPRPNHSIVFQLFTTKFSSARQFKNHIELFSLFSGENRQKSNVKCKIWKRKQTKNPLNAISIVYFL